MNLNPLAPPFQLPTATTTPPPPPSLPSSSSSTSSGTPRHSNTTTPMQSVVTYPANWPQNNQSPALQLTILNPTIPNIQSVPVEPLIPLNSDAKQFHPSTQPPTPLTPQQIQQALEQLEQQQQQQQQTQNQAQNFFN